MSVQKSKIQYNDCTALLLPPQHHVAGQRGVRHVGDIEKTEASCPQQPPGHRRTTVRRNPSGWQFFTIDRGSYYKRV